MNPLSGFSDWALALLPRLLLYPGGIGLVGGLLLVGLYNQQSGHHSLLTILAGVNILPTAVAWVAVALLPMPGAAPLPLPVDNFVLIALPAASLLLDNHAGLLERWASTAVVAALVSTMASAALMPPPVQSSPFFTGGGTWTARLLAGAAIMLAMSALASTLGQGWGQAIRWLAWGGLAATLTPLPSVAAGLGLLVLAPAAGWLVERRGLQRQAIAGAYLMAACSLFVALLQ